MYRTHVKCQQRTYQIIQSRKIRICYRVVRAICLLSVLRFAQRGLNDWLTDWPLNMLLLRLVTANSRTFLLILCSCVCLCLCVCVPSFRERFNYLLRRLSTIFVILDCCCVDVHVFWNVVCRVAVGAAIFFGKMETVSPQCLSIWDDNEQKVQMIAVFRCRSNGTAYFFLERSQ